MQRVEIVNSDLISDLEEWAHVSELSIAKKAVTTIKTLQQELAAEEDDCNTQAALVTKFFTKFRYERKMSERLAEELKNVARTESATNLLAEYAFYQKANPISGE